MTRIVRLRIFDENHVARAVMAATKFAREMGFGVQDTHVIKTVVSELARNIVKYAGRGDVLLAEANMDELRGIEIKVSDRGPGIESIEDAMRDHFSSGGTLGLGLPGVKRMMDEFEIESRVGKGTRVTARKWQRPTRSGATGSVRRVPSKSGDREGIFRRRSAPKRGRLGDAMKLDPRIDSACFVRPYQGEHVSGDAVVTDRRTDLMLMAIVDGLGHGVEANRVAIRFKKALLESWSGDPVASMRSVHEQLSGTIGAAAGICTLDISTGDVRYAGVGNTTFRTFGLRGVRLHSAAGTLGARMRSLQECRARLTDSDVLVLYTDGISDRFELSDYPQLRYQRAETIARTIVERFGKSHDDATCAVVRYAR